MISPIASRTVLRGLSEPAGSCRTACTVWRYSVFCWRSICDSGWPLNSTVPLVTGMRSSIIRASVDLPEPDSPTMAMNSPGRAVTLAFFTACTGPAVRDVRKVFETFLASSILARPFGKDAVFRLKRRQGRRILVVCVLREPGTERGRDAVQADSLVGE